MAFGLYASFYLGWQWLIQHDLAPVRSYYIPSESNIPTLQVNDYILVDAHSRPLHRGDMVVFHPPQEHYSGSHSDLIKRLVAVGGESVEIKDGKFWLNGVVQDEPYLAEQRIQGDFPQITVPPGHFFMLGDNRNNSSDSRVFGCVPEGNCIGKAIWIYWAQRDPSRVGKPL
jgi:signal peptidase I